MKVQELMNRVVRTCSEGDSLEQAARTMWECDVGCLVVTDAEQRPIGILTDRDVLMAAFRRGIALSEGRVQSAMTTNVRTVGPNCTLHELERLMQAARIRRVPVVDEGGRLIGIIGLGDLAQYSQWTANHLMGVHGLAKTLWAVTEAATGTRTAAE
ncbi:MAG TPA: CBS domain-containing protein [Polyangiaceae bacterium]